MITIKNDDNTTMSIGNWRRWFFSRYRRKLQPKPINIMVLSSWKMHRGNQQRWL